MSNTNTPKPGDRCKCGKLRSEHYNTYGGTYCVDDSRDERQFELASPVPDKAAHTPGPWTFEIDERPNGIDDCIIVHEGVPIATVRGTNDMELTDNDDAEVVRIEMECIANAELIAKAPDTARERDELAREVERLKKALTKVKTHAHANGWPKLVEFINEVLSREATEEKTEE